MAALLLTTLNSVAFLDCQVYEVIRPLVSLLHTDRDGKQNYEALRGLTNLAGFSEKLRYD